MKAHVGLPGAHPDFTYEDVLDFLLIRAANGDDLRLIVCGNGVQFDGPLAVFSSFCGFCLTGESHGHFRASGVPAPERIGLLLLKHHVIRDDGGKFKFCVRRKGHGQKRQE